MLKAIGALLVAFGGIWALQGLGWLGWPADSFMLDRREWALYGLLTAGAGAALVIAAGRVRR
ncbi:MAG: hypothetical protein GC147_00820 [Porphyrobacter sp.]|nr:hypothetical protein [Porphyrobacter sp.]